jgi:hypothetical protein
MEIIPNDTMYFAYKAKAIATFDKLDTLLIETKLDLLEICTQEKFNGRFKAIKYKEVPISDVEYQEYLKKQNADNK